LIVDIFTLYLLQKFSRWQLYQVFEILSAFNKVENLLYNKKDVEITVR